MSIFNPVTGVKLGVLVPSNTITANFGPATPVSITVNPGNSSLWKNGVSVGSSTTINNGDTLFIRAQSASSYISASHTTILIGTTYYTYTIVTRTAPETQVYTPFVDVLPVNLTVQQDGSAYVPNLTNNYVAQMDSTGTVLSTVGIPVSSGTVGTTNDTIVVANYFSDSVSVVDVTTKAVVATIALPVGSKPHSVTYTYVSETDRRSMAWVTLSGKNQVVLIGPDHTILGTYPTGVKPMGISASFNGRHVWVANNGSGTVTRFLLDRGTSTWSPTTFAAAAGVLDVAVDLTGRAWVICATGNTFYRIDKTGLRTSYTTGSGSGYGSGYRSIRMGPDGLYVYIAVSRGPTLLKYSAVTGASVGGLSINSSTFIMPYGLTVTADENVYMTCFVTKNVVKINGKTMTLIDSYDTTDGGTFPYGVAATPDNKVWLANYYDSTPHYNLSLDQSPDLFAFLPHSGQELDTMYDTESFTVTGLPNATPVSIPGVFGAQILKNGLPVSFGTTTINGDTLAIRYHTPNDFDIPIEIPMFIGNVSAALVSSTTAAPSKPDDVTFDVIFVKAPVSNQETSNATISGLGATSTCKITVSDTDHWHFRLNGVEMLDADGKPLKIVTVKNGDVFSLVGIADLNLGEDVLVEVQAIVGPNKVGFGHLSVEVPTIHNGMYWVHISAQYVEDAFLVGKLDNSSNNARTVEMPTAEVSATYDTSRVVSLPTALVNLQPTRTLVTLPTPLVAPTKKAFISASSGFEIAPQRPIVLTPVAQYIEAPERATHITEVAKYAPKVDFTQVVAPVPKYVVDLPQTQVTVAPKYEKLTDWTLRTAEPKYVKEADYPLRKYVPLFHKELQGSLRDVAPKYEKDEHVVQLYPDNLPKYSVVGTVIQPTTVPVFFVVQPPEIRTIPGQNNDDFMHEISPVRRLAPQNIYVSAGTPNDPRTCTAEGFIKRESSLQRLADPMQYDRLVPNRILSEPAQYDKVYYVHQVNHEYPDTLAQQGLYQTYEGALAAGEAAGHTLVNAKLMPSGGWMWNYSIPLPINGCFGEVDPQPPIGTPKPQKWYVHGG